MHTHDRSANGDLFVRDVLELLFDRIPLGIIVLNREFRLLRYNATWADYFTRYKPAFAPLIQQGRKYFELLPESRQVFEPVFNRVLSGEVVRESGLGFMTAGRMSYWNVIGTPIVQSGEIISLLLVGSDVTEQIEAREAEQRALVELQAAYDAIEMMVADRTRELTTLMTVQQALTSSLDQKEVLHLIASEARRMTNTEIAGVFLPHDDQLELAALSSEYPIGIEPGYRMSLTDSITGVAFRTGSVHFVDNVPAHPHVDPNAIHKAHLNALLAIPLISGSRTIGVLSVGNKVGGKLGAEDERLLTMMAPSVVIALENVREYEQASEMAIAAERGRLARDLHDSVTQTLFSASLTAEVLPRIWARSPEDGMARLEKLRELTRGALAEMRTLLLELRPAALLDMPLSDLLRQLSEGVAGRSQIAIGLLVAAETDPPAEVKIALYRIAQEALNNIAKHAKATNAQVAIAYNACRAELTISDDGIGFDPSANRANHLGLRIMRERAESIRATLIVEAVVDHGTRITVTWPEQETPPA